MSSVGNTSEGRQMHAAEENLIILKNEAVSMF